MSNKYLRFYSVRLNDDQFEYFSRKEAASKMNRREFFLSLISCNHLTIKQIDTKELYSAISRIGNNINQIAHVANMMLFDRCDLERIDEFRMELIELKKEVLRLIKRMEGGDG